MLRAEDPVEEGALGVVGAGRVSRPAEDVARQLQHVVRAAALLRVDAELRGELPGVGAPLLLVARPARRVAALRDDLGPEVARGRLRARIARRLVSPRRADDLGDLGVDVKPAELVAAL